MKAEESSELSLPIDLSKACDALEEDREFLKEIFPDSLIQHWVQTKEKNIDIFLLFHIRQNMTCTSTFEVL